jgi:hypothetical protein
MSGHQKQGPAMPWHDMDTHWMKQAIGLAREGEAEPGKNPMAA